MSLIDCPSKSKNVLFNETYIVSWMIREMVQCKSYCNLSYNLVHSAINFSVSISGNLILLRVNEKYIFCELIFCEIIPDQENIFKKKKKGGENKVFNNSLSGVSFPMRVL